MPHLFLFLTILAYSLSLGSYVRFLYSGREIAGRLGTLFLTLGLVAHYFALLERSRGLHTVPYHDLYGSMSLFGWLLAIQRPSLVKAVVGYEPGVVFPSDAVPPPIPLYKGTMAAGAPVSPADFLKLTRMPLQILYGDNIPTAPIPDLVADGRRAQIVAARLF